MRGSIADVMRCPNCGHEQPGGEAECRSCQVIFEKLAQRQARRELGMGCSATPVPNEATVVYACPELHPEAQFSAPDQAALNEAAAAGALVGTITLLAIGIEAAGWVQLGLGPLAVFDVLLAFGLAYGTSKGSRVCASSLLLYFVASKLAQWAQHPPSVAGIWLPLAIMGAMGKGALASFNRRA